MRPELRGTKWRMRAYWAWWHLRRPGLPLYATLWVALWVTVILIAAATI